MPFSFLTSMLVCDLLPTVNAKEVPVKMPLRTTDCSDALVIHSVVLFFHPVLLLYHFERSLVIRHLSRNSRYWEVRKSKQVSPCSKLPGKYFTFSSHFWARNNSRPTEDLIQEKERMHFVS